MFFKFDAVLSSSLNAPALGLPCTRPCGVLRTWASRCISKKCMHIEIMSMSWQLLVLAPARELANAWVFETPYKTLKL